MPRNLNKFSITIFIKNKVFLYFGTDLLVTQRTDTNERCKLCHKLIRCFECMFKSYFTNKWTTNRAYLLHDHRTDGSCHGTYPLFFVHSATVVPRPGIDHATVNGVPRTVTYPVAFRRNKAVQMNTC